MTEKHKEEQGKITWVCPTSSVDCGERSPGCLHTHVGTVSHTRSFSHVLAVCALSSQLILHVCPARPPSWSLNYKSAGLLAAPGISRILSPSFGSLCSLLGNLNSPIIARPSNPGLVEILSFPSICTSFRGLPPLLLLTSGHG